MEQLNKDQKELFKRNSIWNSYLTLVEWLVNPHYYYYYYLDTKREEEDRLNLVLFLSSTFWTCFWSLCNSCKLDVVTSSSSLNFEITALWNNLSRFVFVELLIKLELVSLERRDNGPRSFAVSRVPRRALPPSNKPCSHTVWRLPRLRYLEMNRSERLCFFFLYSNKPCKNFRIFFRIIFSGFQWYDREFRWGQRRTTCDTSSWWSLEYWKREFLFDWKAFLFCFTLDTGDWICAGRTESMVFEPVTSCCCWNRRRWAPLSLARRFKSIEKDEEEDMRRVSLNNIRRVLDTGGDSQWFIFCCWSEASETAVIFECPNRPL